MKIPRNMDQIKAKMSSNIGATILYKTYEKWKKMIYWSNFHEKWKFNKLIISIKMVMEIYFEIVPK